MTDFDRAYRDLADEADTVHLAPPNDLRSRGDRRTRMRVVSVIAAAAVAVGGATGGAQWLLRADSGPPVTPGGTPTATLSPAPPAATPSTPAPSPPPASPSTTGAPRVSASASATGRPVPRSIPDSAFLQVGDTNGTVPVKDVSSEEMLPELCGATYRSDAKVQVRRTRHVTYWTAPKPEYVPDGTFDETITAYKAGGAKDFMAQLRKAVGDCAKDGDGRYKIVPASKHGDDSFVFEWRYPATDAVGNPTGGDEVRLVSVVRVGDVVMVLYERGWEAGWTADPDVVETFTVKAMSRLSKWLARL